MKTLFIHVGMPKTGTTSIQSFCANNNKILYKKGYIYPQGTKKYAGVSENRNGHFLAGSKKMSKEVNKRILERELQNLLPLFSEKDNIILSDEAIWSASSYRHKFLYAILNDFAIKHNICIKFIIYLRRQDDFLMSFWNQMLKAVGETKTWDEYFSLRKDSKTLDYYGKINEIAEAFGKSSIVVRRYDASCFVNGSLVDDFLHSIGLKMSDEYLTDNDLTNQGLYGNAHEFQRIINSFSSLTDRRKRLISMEIRSNLVMNLSKFPSSMMSVEEREEFLLKFKDDNEKIALEYICDGKPMFSYDIPNLPKWDRNNEFFESDLNKFIEFVLNLNLDMLQDNKKVDEKKPWYLLNFFK